MRLVIAVLVMIGVLAGGVRALQRKTPAPVFGYQVVNVYPHDAKAFTQPFGAFSHPIRSECLKFCSRHSLGPHSTPGLRRLNAITLPGPASPRKTDHADMSCRRLSRASPRR